MVPLYIPPPQTPLSPRGYDKYPPCIGERTISFLVKFESSVLCKLMLYIGHLGYLIPHLLNKKADFRSQVFKK